MMRLTIIIEDIKKEIFKEMIQYNLVDNEYNCDIFTDAGYERPPMIEIPEYCEKFGVK